MYYSNSMFHTRKWQRIKTLAMTSAISFGIGAVAMLQIIAHAVGVYN